MIGIVLEQFRKIENSSRTLEHVFAGVGFQNPNFSGLNLPAERGKKMGIKIVVGMVINLKPLKFS